MKKMISILIALTMLVSVIPSAFAEGEEVEVTSQSYRETYDFYYAAVGLSAITKLYEIDGNKTSDAGDNIYDKYGWKYFDMSDDLLKKAEVATKLLGDLRNTTDHLSMRIKSYAASSVDLKFALSHKLMGASGFYIPKVMLEVGNAGSSSMKIMWYMSPVEDGKVTVEDYLKDNKLIMDLGITKWKTLEFVSQNAIYFLKDKEVISAFSSGNGDYEFHYIDLVQILNPIMTLLVDNISFDIADGDTTNDTTSASVVVSGKTVVDSVEETVTNMPVSNNFITYKSSKDSVATVSADGTVTAVGAGEAKIWAESKDGLVKSKEITVTVAGATEPSDDEALTNAFDAKEETVNTYVESTVTGITEDTTIKAEKNSDGTFSLTAPETKSDKKFLYWAKGMSANKKIVSFDSVLSDYMPEEDGKNYLVAVYEGDVSDIAEYYNANGQRIATKTEPALPSMAGFGKATGWKRYGETNIYVAEYEGKTQPDNVTVTVDGKANTVPYGTEIVCTADSTKENFKCWTKSDINGETEIVSVNETYKFNAWEDCEVTAIYEDHIYKGDKFKIIIDTFTVGEETGVMAEFIGLDNAVEKGIMFGTKKIAMTRPGNQFTVTADKDGTFKGYAIVGNVADGYTMITDGEITVTAGK